MLHPLPEVLSFWFLPSWFIQLHFDPSSLPHRMTCGMKGESDLYLLPYVSSWYDLVGWLGVSCHPSLLPSLPPSLHPSIHHWVYVRHRSFYVYILRMFQLWIVSICCPVCFFVTEMKHDSKEFETLHILYLLNRVLFLTYLFQFGFWILDTLILYEPEAECVQV